MQIPKPQRIACRICEQIFSNPQTLISHIESCHMKNDLLQPTATPLSYSAGKPLSLTPSLSPSAAARSYSNPLLYQNSYNHYPPRNHIDLNYYRNYLYNHGRFQNGFPATPTSHFPATPTMRNNKYMFGQPPRQYHQQQMQLLPATTPPENGDLTLPLLCQLEHRSPETYVPIIIDDDSGPNFVDLTLKL